MSKRQEDANGSDHGEISRRQLFDSFKKSAVLSGLAASAISPAQAKQLRQVNRLDAPPPAAQLAGTEPFTRDGDLAEQMVADIYSFLLRQTEASIQKRGEFWQPVYTSRPLYEHSVAPNRQRLARIIGVIDERLRYEAPEMQASFGQNAVVAIGDGYKIYRVRWPVFTGVDGEGLLLEPAREPIGRVIAMGDADWTPEMLIGLQSGIATEAQYAKRLAENGCLVLIPTLIDRQSRWSGNENLGKRTNLTHREYIYRMAYEIGRHVIGYEVQRVLAAVDWLAATRPSRPVGLIGYAEGGLLALCSAALDTRIDVTVVSGYFQSRQQLWQEPLYRNIWSFLREFGDAELATLIAPRTLIIEASQAPEIPGPPAAIHGASDSAASGRLTSPPLAEVREEVERARPSFEKLNANHKLIFTISSRAERLPGADETLQKFLWGLGTRNSLRPLGGFPHYLGAPTDPQERLHRQFEQLIQFTQDAIIESEAVREKFWSKADDSSIENWQNSTDFYRHYLWEEIFGKLPEPSERLIPQSRKIYDETSWTGYEIVLPLWPDVFAYGILLLPRPIEAGERRPVVVCQHGLEGRPQDLIKPNREGDHYYHCFAADLADHGFVVYCPQNPYIGGDHFRKLQRLANPLKLSLFSFILSQHERTLEWLAEQPFVNAERIGFYGLSYGGKTAVRVPPLLSRYALSICSGDFNEWIWKVSRDDAPFTYIFTPEYEVSEFNLGNTFNHSDMAKLMTPRPFMIERGHDDAVSVDSWVAYEYAKVRYHYDLLALSERTRIGYFNGPHTIHGVETFQFLHRFLNWGEPFAW